MACRLPDYRLPTLPIILYTLLLFSTVIPQRSEGICALSDNERILRYAAG
jgi:hypothetical protein